MGPSTETNTIEIFFRSSQKKIVWEWFQKWKSLLSPEDLAEFSQEKAQKLLDKIAVAEEAILISTEQLQMVWEWMMKSAGNTVGGYTFTLPGEEKLFLTISEAAELHLGKEENIISKTGKMPIHKAKKPRRTPALGKKTLAVISLLFIGFCATLFWENEQEIPSAAALPPPPPTPPEDSRPLRLAPDIEKTRQKFLPQVQSLYREFKEEKLQDPGLLKINVNIDSAGRVASYRLVETNIKNYAFLESFYELLESWNFGPADSAGIYVATLELKLTP